MATTPGTTRAPLPTSVEALRDDIAGIDTSVPVLSGGEQPYVFLDNAASTPAFGRVLQCIAEFMPWYSGVHRGTGFKSVLSTVAFDEAHAALLRFAGADPGLHTAILTKNTTECINKLANRAGLTQDDVVITTLLEHHSNDLPWRKHARVIHVGMLPDGRLDCGRLKETIERHAGKVRFVAVTGASNITGLIPPVHEIAVWAHAAGARMFVDAAQLAAHRRMAMGDPRDPGHIDFLAFSAHKMYAPFGCGALIGPRTFFEQGDPDMVGGGVVDVVTLDRAYWNRPPHKEEAGSPNVVGGIAMAEAAMILQSVTLEAIARHEARLVEYANRRLQSIPGVILYGPTDPATEKVGVISFAIEGVHHALASAIMSVEGAIGVRNGCFCAHPYVKELLGMSAADDKAHEAAVLSGDKSAMPGMIRASLGCYNTEDDIDRLAAMVRLIAGGKYHGTYRQDRKSGAYHCEGFSPAYERWFPFLADLQHGTRRDT